MSSNLIGTAMPIKFKKLKQPFKLSFKDKLTFGQYLGKSVKEVLELDPAYLYWIHLNTSYRLTDNVIQAVLDKGVKYKRPNTRKIYIHNEDIMNDLDQEYQFAGFFDDIPF